MDLAEIYHLNGDLSHAIAGPEQGRQSALGDLNSPRSWLLFRRGRSTRKRKPGIDGVLELLPGIAFVMKQYCLYTGGDRRQPGWSNALGAANLTEVAWASGADRHARLDLSREGNEGRPVQTFTSLVAKNSLRTQNSATTWRWRYLKKGDTQAAKA
jgi:hypothetical protein